MHNTTYRGSCLCQGVQFEVDQIEPRMAHCHCSMCRKFHGAAFATYGEARKNNFRWLRGEQLLKSYTAKNRSTRRFCQNCGSSLTFAPAKQNDFVEFALASLDTEIKQTPDAHVFTAYKADWYKIIDDLPQFKEGRLTLDR
ncbi:MAG: GFA family protein [Gammaproteobacteria bacterium]|nr:GFA family protein [Gammaproteobacteria bacterium]